MPSFLQGRNSTAEQAPSPKIAFLKKKFNQCLHLVGLWYFSKWKENSCFTKKIDIAFCFWTYSLLLHAQESCLAGFKGQYAVLR